MTNRWNMEDSFPFAVVRPGNKTRPAIATLKHLFTSQVSPAPEKQAGEIRTRLYLLRACRGASVASAG